jgi:hypothetical protein
MLALLRLFFASELKYMTENHETGNYNFKTEFYRCFVGTVDWSSDDIIYRRQATHET